MRLGLFVGVVFVAGVAAAGEPDPMQIAAARALFDDARALMTAGRWDAACPKLEQAVEVLPTAGGAKYHLGVCYEHTGKLVRARAIFVEVAEAERIPGHEDRERVARSAAAAIESRVAHLTVRRSARSLVTCDGTDVTRAEIVLDPGAHSLATSTWSKTVVLAEGESAVVDVPDPAPRVTLAAPVIARSSSHAPPPTAFALAGLGIGWLTGASILTGVAVAEYDASNGGHCSASTNQCVDMRGVELRDQSFTHGNMATVGFVLGAGSLVGAVIVWLVVPSHAVRTTAMGIEAAW